MEFGTIRFTFKFAVSAEYLLPVVNSDKKSKVFKTDIMCYATDHDEAKDCMVAYLHDRYESVEIIQIQTYKLTQAMTHSKRNCIYFPECKKYAQLLDNIIMSAK